MLTIAGRIFHSRLFGGTGKFSSPQVMKDALEASGCEMVTVALRRIDLKNPEDDIMSMLDRQRYLFLPNTSGARDANEAVRLAHLARASGGGNWLKLEVTPDPRTLLPDPVALLPDGMFTASLGVTDDISVEGFYQYKWKETEIPPSGSYFGFNDFATDGGNMLFLGSGLALGIFVGVRNYRKCRHGRTKMEMTRA